MIAWRPILIIAAVLTIAGAGFVGGYAANEHELFGMSASDAARHVAHIEDWRQVTCQRDTSTSTWACTGTDEHGCQRSTVYDEHDTHRVPGIPVCLDQ